MGIISELGSARRAAKLSQQALAEKAGVARLTVSRVESARDDVRLSTLLVLARALGLELMLVPSALRPELENFVSAGGRYVGQASGIDAPRSIVDDFRPPKA
jgi:transcriptional regulator with XRE-family HTH domain